jgi:hypothetical protein
LQGFASDQQQDDEQVLLAKSWQEPCRSTNFKPDSIKDWHFHISLKSFLVRWVITY